MNIPLLSTLIAVLLLSQTLILTVHASEKMKKTSIIKATTPAPSNFAVKNGKIIDLKKNKALFFKGMGYSPYLPGENPLKGAAPGNDERYLEHLTVMRDMGVNYLHVFPLKMPPKFFIQLDTTDMLYGQDIWLDGYVPDFLAKDYQALMWTIIKETIDLTYQVGRPDRLVLFSIGDELQAKSVISTDANNPNVKSFTGKHVQVTNRTPTEVALAQLIDKAIDYELTTYGRRHLYCHTSWTHIGPLNRSDLDVASQNRLMPDIGDLVCLNVYTYARGVVTSLPGSKTKSSYQGYLEELAASTDKPIFITQAGLSTSPFEPKPYSAPGFGGHKEKDVPAVFKSIWKDLHTAKGNDKFCGIAFFELHDEWWKSGEDPVDSTKHEREDPEEWFGLFEVGVDHRLIPKKNIPNTVRKLYTTD
ncbi:MAG: hypothetical protein KAH20_10340 [Methylococcales bacterium]|nr:hypothetical protein [Methylococcales bacterium]